LQSHFVWFRFSNWSIVILPFVACLLTIGKVAVDRPKRQTSTVTPAKPRRYLFYLADRCSARRIRPAAAIFDRGSLCASNQLGYGKIDALDAAAGRDERMGFFGRRIYKFAQARLRRLDPSAVNLEIRKALQRA
jgi:hypothetical protein